MTTTGSPAHDPVLVLVPGACGAPADGGAPVRRADAAVAQLLVTDLVATRGDGVFETVGVFDGAPINLGPHLRRLGESARMIDLPDPDLDTIGEGVATAVEAHASVPELTVRIMLTRGPEPGEQPTCWVHARIADDWQPQRQGIRVLALDRGVSTAVATESPWLLAGAKTLSYAVNMAATREARRRGADDVLFVSSDGFALEGPTSTLLVRHGETFTTTPPSAGVLAGTSVVTIFETLGREGFTTREELMTPEAVVGSDGAWLLSSGRLAAPITHLDDRPLTVDHALTARFIALLSGRE